MKNKKITIPITEYMELLEASKKYCEIKLLVLGSGEPEEIEEINEEELEELLKDLEK